MANWANPTVTSTYTNFVTEVKDRDTDAVTWFEGITPTNTPTNAKRLNTSNNRFEKWNGSSWVDALSSFTFPAASIAGTLSVTGNTALSTMTASGNVTLNGGTANGVAYLNGSKVLTSGSGLTFDGTSFAVGGVPTVQGELNVFKSGSAPTLYVQGDTSNSTTQGIIRIGGASARSASIQGYRETSSNLHALRFYSYNSADQLNYEITSGGTSIWSVGGSEQMRLTSTGLGIGTSSPSEALTVARTNYAYVRTESTTNSVIGYYGVNGPLSSMYFGTTSNHPVLFVQNNAEQMRLTSTGLGIGTSSPTHKLQVNGAGRFGQMTTGPGLLDGSSDNFRVGLNQDNTNTSNTQVWSEYTTGASSASFAVRYRAANDTGTASTRMYLDAVTGNLGLGVTPSAWNTTWKALQLGNGAAISGRTDNATISYVHANSFRSTSGNWAYTTTNVATMYAQDTGLHIWYTAPSGTAGATTSITSGQVYTVTTLSSTTLAQWQALFSGLSALPTVGQSITATASGTLAGGATVTQVITFTQAMTLNASGNLGIGTTSPASRLHVAGTSRFVSGATSTAAITITQGFINGDISSGNLTIGNFGDASSEMRVATRGFATFYTGATDNATGTERMRLDSAGNLGIGTGSPVAKTQISRGTGASAPTTISKANAYLGLGATEYNTSSYRLIGFGYSSTEAQYPAYLGYIETITSGATYGDLVFFTRNVNTDTAPSERVRIDSSGRMLIGGDTGQVNSGSDTPFLQAIGNTSSQSTIQSSRFQANSGGAILTLAKSRNATLGSHTIVSNGDSLGSIRFDASNGTSFVRGADISATVSAVPSSTSMPTDLVFATTASGATVTTDRLVLTSAGVLRPAADNTQGLGTTSFRWSQLFAGTTTISTSDARQKTAVRPLQDAEIAAAQDMLAEIGTYQFLESVEAKGDSARRHAGMTVQRAIEIMQSHELDPFAYSFICHDSWEATYKDVPDEDGDLERTIERQRVEVVTTDKQVVQVIDGAARLVTVTETQEVPQFIEMDVLDEDGEPVMVDDQPMKHRVPDIETVTERYRRVEVKPAGDLYSFRTEGLLLFMARGLDARIKSLEAA